MEVINEKSEAEEMKTIFSQNLLFFRKKLNISQKELSEKIQTSNKNISKWERAETIPDIITIKKLATLFNITVDTLINPITNDNKKAIDTKNVIPLKWKIYLLLFVNSVILLFSCILFFVFKSIQIESFNIYLIYLYMLPLMCLNTFIFICIISKKVDPVSLSIFGWLLSICFYITFINTHNIKYIFIITIAYQILAPIFAELINSRKIIKINKILLTKWKKHDSTELEENSKKTQNNN